MVGVADKKGKKVKRATLTEQKHRFCSPKAILLKGKSIPFGRPIWFMLILSALYSLKILSEIFHFLVFLSIILSYQEFSLFLPSHIANRRKRR